MKNLLADGRGGWVADGRLCRSRVAVKLFVFIISRNVCKFLISCFVKFSSNFVKFKIILSQFCVLQNFDNAVSQPPYVGVEWGGGSRYRRGAPSALKQIVPYSSSLYTVFHSVIYNSVIKSNSATYLTLINTAPFGTLITPGVVPIMLHTLLWLLVAHS